MKTAITEKKAPLTLKRYYHYETRWYPMTAKAHHLYTWYIVYLSLYDSYHPPLTGKGHSFQLIDHLSP